MRLCVPAPVERDRRGDLPQLRARPRFQIGDVRDYAAVSSVLRDADVVFNAAALKQVPTCEYFPYEAVLTNIVGAENIARAIREHDSRSRPSSASRPTRPPSP